MVLEFAYKSEDLPIAYSFILANDGEASIVSVSFPNFFVQPF